MSNTWHKKQEKEVKDKIKNDIENLVYTTQKGSLLNRIHNKTSKMNELENEIKLNDLFNGKIKVNNMSILPIYKFQLDQILTALAMTSKIHNSSKGETCHDRNVRQAYQYAKNALENKIDTVVDYMKEIKETDIKPSQDPATNYRIELEE